MLFLLMSCLLREKRELKKDKEMRNINIENYMMMITIFRGEKEKAVK